MIAGRFDRFDRHRLSGRLRRSDDRLGGEVEGDSKDVGILDVEQPLFIELVRLPPQRPADDLLAEELGAEGPDAEDMGDGVGVPALGEHRHRDDTPNPAAERARLADGVHHLAEQVLVGEISGVLLAAGAFHDLPPKSLDLVSGHGAEAGIEGVA